MVSHVGKNVVIVLALVAAGFFVAWLRFRPYLGNESQFTDGSRMYDITSPGEVRYAVWDRPERLDETVNTNESERRPAVSPDGRLLVFAGGERGLGADLYVSELVDGEPTEPRALEIVNSSHDEWAPCFAGDALYFASDRPGTAGGLDLWRAAYSMGSFEQPVRLNGGLNSTADDTDPAPVPGTDGLVFASNRLHERRIDFDLYHARPQFNGATETTAGDGADERSQAWLVEPVASLNTPFDEREPALTVDGLHLFFASDRVGGAGGFDLYRSVLSQGQWIPPEALLGVNGAGDERGPSPARDGFRLLFDAQEGATSPDLFSARSIELFRQPGRPVGWRELLILSLLLLLALLAWLAKQWEQVEILYKCLLVSLVAHLLLMWWMRDVYPEGGEYELDGDSNRIRVRLLASANGALARNTERAGELDVGLRAPEQVDVLERMQVETDRGAASAPARARLERAAPEEVARPAPRAVAELERTRAERETTSVRMQQERLERRSETAPSLQLDADAESPDAASVRTALASPERSATEATDSVSTPAARQQALAPAGTEMLAAPSGRSAVVTPSERAPGERVALAAPREILSLRDAAVAELSIDVGFKSELSERGEPTLQRAAAPERERAAGSEPAPEPGRLSRALASEAGLDPLAGRAEATYEPQRRELPALALEVDAFAPTTSEPASSVSANESLLADMSAASNPGARPQARRERAPGRVSERTQRAREDAAQVPAFLPSRQPTPRADALALPEPATRSRADTQPSARRTLEQALADARLSDETDTTVAREEELARERARREAWEAGVERDLLDALATLEAPARPEPRRAGSMPMPGRMRRELPEEASAPSYRALALLEPADQADRTAREERVVSQERWELTPYQLRSGEAKLRAIETHGGSQETERAVASGLAYLSRIQASQGYWGSARDQDDKYGHVAVGKTGLCMLAFMGAGHTQSSSSDYSPVVRKAIAFLLAVQDEDTGHFGYCASYGHAIATYALAECFALTGDEQLRDPLEHAVAWILRRQERRADERFFGGWGYYYPTDRVYDRWPRASVTVWQVMALESARLAGLEVPDAAFENAHTFLTGAWDRRRGAYRYSHDPERLDSAYPILPGSTPAALFALSLLGEDIASPKFSAARDFLLERLPSGYRYTGDDDFVYRARGNLYFWYYATLALFRVGDGPWRAWNEAMKETLLPAQEEDGSWEPISIYAEYAGDDDDDRSYTTAMSILTLEVYYRYFTPLLEVKPGKKRKKRF